MSGRRVSEVEAVHSMANYWKHEPEWRGIWQRIKSDATQKEAGRTIEVIEAAGAVGGSSGNFRTVSGLLGVVDPGRLDRLYEIVDAWREQLAADYEAELKRHGLI